MDKLIDSLEKAVEEWGNDDQMSAAIASAIVSALADTRDDSHDAVTAAKNAMVLAFIADYFSDMGMKATTSALCIVAQEAMMQARQKNTMQN